MTKALKGLENGDWYTGKYPDNGLSILEQVPSGVDAIKLG
jgi:hypothetical protein